MDKFLIKKPKKSEPSTSSTSTVRSVAAAATPDEVEDNAPEIHDSEIAMEEDHEERGDTSEEPREKQKKKTYTQKFRSTWKEKHPWLLEKDGKNFCNICSVVLTGGGFHLKRHEKSVTHLRKLAVVKSTRKVTEVLQKPDFLSTSVTNAELKWTAYLCEKNLPLSLVDSLVEVSSSIYLDSAIAKAVKLKRSKATKIIKEKLGPMCEKTVMEDLKNNFFSLIIDESTDISSKKSLVILARYWKDQQVRDIFVKLVEVLDASADGLCQVIKNLLNANNIPYNNLIGFGSDNASTMMGSIKGVQARLREINPNIVVQGCSCHSLHLCASAASKKLPNHIEQFARDIYSYFAHSSRRLSELQECQIFAQEKPHKLLYPSQTRWLAMHGVVNRILEHWNSLVLFFQGAALQDNIPSAAEILNKLQNPLNKLYFLFLSYILQIVTQTNLELQSENPKVPLLLIKITTLYKLCLKSFIKREVIDKTPLKEIAVRNPYNYVNVTNIFCGAKIDALFSSQPNYIDAAEIKNFKLRCLDFYVELCFQIKRRFDFDNTYLKFASNFTPEMVLSGNKLSIAEAENLFPQLKLNIEEINLEWQLISVTDSLKKYINLELNEFWTVISNSKNDINQPMFGKLMVLVKVILSLPHSSAAAERVFSQLSLIKTRIRNTLSIETCSHILHVKQNVHLVGSTAKWLPTDVFFKKSMEPDAESESDVD